MARKYHSAAHVVSVINRQGWYPSPWAHHPPEVKEAIRAMGWRPRVKQCFANCQRFALQSGLDVEYREGWAATVIAFEHAWLVYKGKVLDLTLIPDREVKYMESVTATREDIRRNMVETLCYTLIKPREVELIGPYASVFKELHAMANQGILEFKTDTDKARADQASMIEKNLKKS